MNRQTLLRSLPKEKLQELFNKHNCVSAVLDELGFSKTSIYYRNIIKERMLELDLTQYYLNGEEKSPYYNNYKIYENEEVFLKNSNASINTVKRRYEKINPPSECGCCKLSPVWNNLPLVLQLDHKNGNNKDNRIENLRWLCPNCHSQTATYTGKNKLNK